MAPERIKTRDISANPWYIWSDPQIPVYYRKSRDGWQVWFTYTCTQLQFLAERLHTSPHVHSFSSLLKQVCIYMYTASIPRICTQVHMYTASVPCWNKFASTCTQLQFLASAHKSTCTQLQFLQMYTVSWFWNCTKFFLFDSLSVQIKSHSLCVSAAIEAISAAAVHMNNRIKDLVSAPLHNYNYTSHNYMYSTCTCTE